MGGCRELSIYHKVHAEEEEEEDPRLYVNVRSKLVAKMGVFRRVHLEEKGHFWSSSSPTVTNVNRHAKGIENGIGPPSPQSQPVSKSHPPRLNPSSPTILLRHMSCRVIFVRFMRWQSSLHCVAGSRFLFGTVSVADVTRHLSSVPVVQSYFRATDPVLTGMVRIDVLLVLAAG